MKEASTNLNIAFAFDENYITPVYVLLTSIFLNNPNNNIQLYAIATGVTDEQKKQIAQYVASNNATITFYALSQQQLSYLVKPGNSWLTVAAYYRIFFPCLVPDNVDKLLYIDTDAIVLKSLSELFGLNAGVAPISAVQEVLGDVRPELNIYDKFNYFNSGVMLMNVAEWKKQQVTEKTAEFVKNFEGKLMCGDQDALNVVLKDNWQQLPGKFNVMFQDVPRKLVKSQYKNFLQDKVIMHYSVGAHKPWYGLNQNKFRYLYFYYLKKSPCAKQKRYIDFKYTPSYIFSFLKIRFRETFTGYYKVAPVLKKASGLLFFFLE